MYGEVYTLENVVFSMGYTNHKFPVYAAHAIFVQTHLNQLIHTEFTYIQVHII